MANQENSEYEFNVIRSRVSQMLEAYKKAEEEYHQMESSFMETCNATGVDVEVAKASVEKMSKEIQQIRQSVKETAATAFQWLSNRNTSSRLVEIEKEYQKILKKFDMGNQEAKTEDPSGSSSSGYDADGETEKKDSTCLIEGSVENVKKDGGSEKVEYDGLFWSDFDKDQMKKDEGEQRE